MPSYLLLRSNKESGPYSLQQLLQLGLKPYDLVWAEGKSAAWRYPSELDELKEFAPVVEEQPFDRFYKKPSEEKHHFETVVEKKPEILIPIVQTNPKPTGKIFVSFPGNKTIVAEQPKPKSNPVIVPEMIEKKKPVVTIEEKTQLKEEYSQPLDEIKKMYAETYLKRKKKISRKKELGSLLKIAGGLAFVSSVVILAYKNLSPGEKAEQKVIAATVQPQQQEKTIIENPAENYVINEAENKPVSVPEENNPIPDENYKKDPVVTYKADNNTGNYKETEKKEVVKTVVPEKANKPKQVIIDENAPGGKVVIDPATGERKKTTRTENGDENIIADSDSKEEIVAVVKYSNAKSLASVSANNYRKRAFGGIMDLQLTVNNKSNFILDDVTVELQYLKPSNETIKTEKIKFSSVAPNSSQTLRIPDFLRGVNIKYKVLSVASSQYDRHLAGL